MANGNKPVTHRKLLQTLWGPDYGDEVEYLRVFVSQLRKKLKRIQHTRVTLLQSLGLAIGSQFLPKSESG